MKTEEAVRRQKKCGNWRPNQTGNWKRRHEIRDNSSSVFRRKPLSKEKNDSRKKTGLSSTKESPCEIKTVGTLNECGTCGKSPPSYHDSRYPSSSTETNQCHIRWDLKKKIGEKKYSRG